MPPTCHGKQTAQTANLLKNANYMDFVCQKFWQQENNAYLCNRKQETNGAIAQLVEQRTENPCVPGSIPGGTTPPFISPVRASGRVFFLHERKRNPERQPQRKARSRKPPAKAYRPEKHKCFIGKAFFREKLHAIEKKAVPLHSLSRQRDVAQLVAHYVRDVGVGRSSRLIPTEGEDETTSFLAFFHTMKQANTHQHHTHETGNAA